MAATMAPYKIQKRDGNFCVVNNAGQVKGTHPTMAAAMAQMRALYAAVPGAAKIAAKKPWTGKQKRAVTVKSAAGDSDEDPSGLALSVEALLDAFSTWMESLDSAAMTPEMKHAQALLGAAETVSDALLEALGLMDPDDTDATEAAAAMPYGDVAYADPGYQADKKKRYPIDTAEHCRAAWSYINQAGNAAKYSPAQRERIKSRIASAAKKFGIDLNREAAELHERLQRNYGPEKAASPMTVPSAPPSATQVGPEPDMQHHLFVASLSDPAMCAICGCGTDAPQHQIPEAAVAVTQVPPSGMWAPTIASWPGTITIGGTWGTNTTATAANTAPVTINVTTGSVPTYAPATTVAREMPVVAPAAAPSVKAFLTEVDGHTLLTAPASAFTVETEKAQSGNKHYLWMRGRFVGAEKANRNGAFWKTQDLELGELTVKNGPLNWLHEERHVIGTIADTKMVAREAAAELAQPYIEATSAIWRWIYPDEAWVIEQASDQGALWYSMECVSESVSCVGDGGCGATASYGDYVKGQGGTCSHMAERSATRHFANPTFLGGAVIVPPVRPGWAEANASVLKEAASLAEQTFNLAGQPEVNAAQWEQLMAQILRYGKGLRRI